jgi:two-component system sensor histidine kinase HydH
MTNADARRNQVEQALPDGQSLPAGHGSLQWWGALIGLLSSIGDTAMLRMLGVTFAINGRDVTLLNAAWFGVTFAILGFLLGGSIDGRRREARAARLIRAQMETIRTAREKLIQNEKLAALGQLAAAIAHEVRNPLAVIRSAAQSLRDTVPAGAADASRSCSFITAEADRLGNLINSLLAFARPVHISPVTVPIAELFGRVMTLAPEHKIEKHVHLRNRAAANLEAIDVDPELMSQVFVGLVANAIEAASNDGEVILDAKSIGSQVELAVSDSGPGIAPELRERVFEPFFTTRAEGVGLGLAIARQIVEAHGGRIEVGESSCGGARFAVILPVVHRDALTA